MLVIVVDYFETHTHTHTWQDSPGWVIGLLQRQHTMEFEPTIPASEQLKTLLRPTFSTYTSIIISQYEMYFSTEIKCTKWWNKDMHFMNNISFFLLIEFKKNIYLLKKYEYFDEFQVTGSTKECIQTQIYFLYIGVIIRQQHSALHWKPVSFCPYLGPCLRNKK